MDRLIFFKPTCRLFSCDLPNQMQNIEFRPPPPFGIGWIEVILLTAGSAWESVRQCVHVKLYRTSRLLCHISIVNQDQSHPDGRQALHTILIHFRSVWQCGLSAKGVEFRLLQLLTVGNILSTYSLDGGSSGDERRTMNLLILGTFPESFKGLSHHFEFSQKWYNGKEQKRKRNADF